VLQVRERTPTPYPSIDFTFGLVVEFSKELRGASSSVEILVWNNIVEDYVVSIFNFTNKFLTSDGVVLLFHLDDLHVLKEIRSYMESYSFQIRMKLVSVNFLSFINSNKPSMKVLIQFFSPFLVSNFMHVPLLIVLSSIMLQTLLNRVPLLVKDLNESNPQLNFFVFSLAYEDLLQKGVNVGYQDVLYNYINVSSMSKSKNGRPF